jgi:hypothetical protein
VPPSAWRTFLGKRSHSYSEENPSQVSDTVRGLDECMNLSCTILGTCASGSVCVMCCAPHVSIRSLRLLHSVHLHAKAITLTFWLFARFGSSLPLCWLRVRCDISIKGYSFPFRTNVATVALLPRFALSFHVMDAFGFMSG